MGSFPNSDGTATIDGPGSSWTNAFSLTVGSLGTGCLFVSNGGVVFAPEISISSTGEVHGDGGVLAGDVFNDGVVSPGGVTGVLTIDGDYEQTPSGILDIELNDPPDLLSVNGQALLAGALNLSLADGFIPGPDPITIVSADTIVGMFDVSTCPAQFNLEYHPGAVTVTVSEDPPADCDESLWFAPSGGDFDDPTKWVGGVAPGALTTAIFDGIADQTFSVYDVFFVTNAVTDRLIVRSNRLVQFKLAGRDYDVLGVSDPELPSIVVGDTAGHSAELSIRNLPPPNVFHGVFGSTTSIAETPNSMGTLTVTDPFTLFGSGDLYVGRRGVGVFDVYTGAAANSTGAVSIGTEAGATGDVLVDGAEWTTTGTVLIIGEFGQATLSVTSGGQVVSNTLGPVILAKETGSSALVTVAGAGSRWAEQVATVLVAGEGDATVTVADGGIIQFRDFAIRSRGQVVGNGALAGDNVINVGAIRPGFPQTPGALSVNGDYRQIEVPPGGNVEASGLLSIDLEGNTPGEYDQLIVTGEARLGGGLFVSLADTYQPQADDSFDFLQTGLINPIYPTFDVAFTTGLPTGKLVAVDYGAGGTALNGQVNLVVLDLNDIIDFGDPASSLLDGLPSAAVAEDFNNDTFPDLAVTVPFLDSVFVLLNDGAGGFPSSVEVQVGSSPSAIATAPLDGGASFDLAVTNAGENSVSILTNNGSGVFVVASTVPVGNNPRAVAARDFREDGSGDIDLVVANADDNTLRVLNNDGSGNFAQGALISVGMSPWAIDPSDLDNDKDADEDIACANRDSDTVSVVLNLGGGSFAPAVNLEVGDTPVDMSVRDFDGSGYDDIVTGNNGDGTLSVMLNNGDGTFAPAVNLPVGELPRSLVAIDMENDQDLDLAVVVTDEQAQRVVRVLRNDIVHDDTQEEQLSFVQDQDLAGGENPALVLSADVDQNGTDDVITINEDVGGGAAAGQPEGSLAVLPNNSGICLWDCGDGNGEVGINDFLMMLADWGGGRPCDFDGGGVSVTDFLILLANWGPCP
jgi:T5SS/PEP-CTERM-associated repeat protein